MLGDTVRHWREQRALTQTILARHIGKSRSYVCEIEHNKVSPSLETFLAIATALAIEPCLLLLEHQRKPLYGEHAHMTHLRHEVEALRREVQAMTLRAAHPPDVCIPV